MNPPTRDNDLPGIFQPVLVEDYEVLYDAVQFIAQERATIEVETLNLVVCGFCGGSANLKHWRSRNEDIRHRQECHAKALIELAPKLSKPITKQE